ncbi:MAG: hypothetical protein Q7R30_00020 [Acidobacteriota bacterium]|nr:hypothetical protein [Acidobacteriota bacterium]
MRSPGLAIAWEFRRSHRWALIALAGYLLVVGIIQLRVLGPGHAELDPPNGVAAVAMAPFSVVFLYFLGVFSFGLTGDLAARQSLYPARMFVLPVSTAALAGWPMVYGATVMASLWLVTGLLTRWPWGIDVPLIWPALLFAVFLAWTQVLTWMPYGLRGLRVIVAVLSLATLDAVVILAVHYEASELLMVALLAPQLPLAYLAACFAVARARRGEVPDWWFGAGRTAKGSRRLPDYFLSPARAQLWFEWRRHGRALPFLVAILLPFEFGLLFVPGNDGPTLVFYVLIAALLTPAVMAGFAAATVSKANAHGRDSYGVTPFTATRPMKSAALIAAKLKMAILSTLAAWGLVAVAIPLGLMWSGTWQIVDERARDAVEVIGAPRAIVITLLVFAMLLASTWKKLVQGLYTGLTGREWIIKTNGFLALSLLVAIGPILEWIIESGRTIRTLWDVWPWVLAVLVCFKMAAATWIAVRLYRSRLLSDRTLVIGAASWTTAVLALYGLLVWLIDSPLIPRAPLALMAILAVPLARVSAAPLALAWNRHR